MCCRRLICLGWCLLGLFWLADAAQAASRKGIAAILLPSWKASEVSLLAQTVVDSRVSEFEFAFWATYPGSPGYGRSRQLIDALLAAGKTVTVRVYLGAIHDRSTHPQLANHASDLNNNLINVYQNHGRVYFKISPALEDEYPDKATWEAAAKVVLQQLNTAVYPRLNMIRCTTNSRSGGQIAIPSTISVGRGNVNVQSENHWTTRGGASCYSNDGQFVYINQERFNNSTTSSSGTRSLSQFKSDGASPGWPYGQNLWRPSYNLHPSNGAGSNRLFDGQYSLSQRLSMAKPAFDAYERAVLLEFLR